MKIFSILFFEKINNFLLKAKTRTMRNKINIQKFFTEFDKMKKAQNVLHTVLIASLGLFLIMKYCNLLSEIQTTITLIILGTYTLWLMFTNLYKQNQVYRILKQVINDRK